MDRGERVLEFVDWGQAVLELLQVTAILMMSVCSESLVTSSAGRIHREDLPGESVFRTFSGSDSTLLLGTDCSILHMLAAKRDFVADFSFKLSIS